MKQLESRPLNVPIKTKNSHTGFHCPTRFFFG
jgi:hypothetical protein